MNIQRLFRLALALVLLLSGTASASPDTLADAMTRQMQINRERYGIVGQSVLVAHNGKVMFRGADGYANLEAGDKLSLQTVIPLYSVSKLFVSTLVMQLVEQGKVDLDKPASLYVPGLPDRWRAITVRQFLNHTSGVPEYFVADRGAVVVEKTTFPPTMKAVFASLADKPLVFSAGTATRYTQTNYLVLSALLEAHYGKPYPQIASERIIRKLHLQHTTLGTAGLPKNGNPFVYIGKDGRLQRDQIVVWPTYAYAHADLYATLDDLATFLQAVSDGKLVSKASLQRFWQPQQLANGQRGDFATGWEYGESGAFWHVGHDGGARLRVRLAYKGSLDGDTYIFIYLTNGSAKPVWSRTLVGSAMAVAAPDQFPEEVLSEKLIGYALAPAESGDTSAGDNAIKAGTTLQGKMLERTVNNTGYAALAFLGADAAIRIFTLNTQFFPSSANTWDSLADAYRAKGDQAKAKLMEDRAKKLSASP